MNLKLLLENLLSEQIEEDIDEVAVSPKQATAEQLALCNANDVAIVLYSPKLILDRIQRAINEHSFKKENISGVGKAPSKDTKSNCTFLLLIEEIRS